MDQQYPQQYFRRWHLATPSQRILKVLADTEPLARLKCFCFWHAPYAYQIRLKTQMLILALMGGPPRGGPPQGAPQRGEPHRGGPQLGEPLQGEPHQGEPQQGEPQQGEPQ